MGTMIQEAREHALDVPLEKRKTNWELVALLAPAILGLLLLTIVPLLYGLWISMSDYDLLSTKATGQWNWFQNYRDLIANKAFWNSLKISLQFTAAAVSLQMIIGFSLALLLVQELRGMTLARTAIISAMVMTPVIVGTAWRLMYNPSWGLITYILSKFGIQNQAFLAQSKTVIPSLILVDVWQWSPFVMLIILAALKCVPVELYEAAVVDGASSIQKFLYITLPMVKPAIAIALLIRTMDCFRTFDTIFAMTGGGPGTSSQNMNIFGYYTGLEFFRISSASAIAVFGLITVTIVCMLIIRVLGVHLWRSQE